MSSNVLINTNSFKVAEKLFLKEEFADVHFIFKNANEIQQVPAHKMILSAQSPVFNRMFYGTLKEKGDVEIVDANADEFTEFLQFFYLYKVTLTTENIEAVVRLADKYDALEWVYECAADLEKELTPKDMCWGYELAVHLNNESLIKFCEQQISANPKDVFATDSFKYCSKTVLERILDLPMPIDEMDIFKAALEWSKQACINNNLDQNNGNDLRAQLGDCLQLIRFSEMQIEDFTTFYKTINGFLTLEEFQDIVMMLTAEGYEPKLFDRRPRHNYIHKWSARKVLGCTRIVSCIEEYETQSQQIVRFSSNHTLWLGAICIYYSDDVGDDDFVYPSVTAITISEINKRSEMKTKVIYEDTRAKEIDDDEILLLTSPVKIKPENFYEIRLDVSKNLNSDSLWASTEKLGDGTIIQFHPSSSSSYDNVIRGLISGFRFNRF